jgi:GNAT superfamily N-acetyltransferase
VREEGFLRAAIEDDLDELVALWAHYIRDHKHNPAYNRIVRTGFVSRRAAFANDIRDEDAAVFVIARRDGGLDGMITCRIELNKPYFQPHRFGRIQTPYVRPDARRRGNLKRLLAAAYRWAREKELLEVRLYVGADNVVANAIAEELGFDAVAVVRRKAIDWSRPPESQVRDHE